MTRNSYRTALLALLLLTAPALADTPEGRFGAGVSAGEPVSILELLAHPETYVDKVVRIEGVVGEVCPKAGCWMDVVVDPQDPSSARLRVKVQDGEIVFPSDITGKRIAAEGKFVRMELEGDQVVSYLEHQAEERGETFDPSTAPARLAIYRIDGTGARLR